jgi:catechol-2,3-dioxygenase
MNHLNPLLSRRGFLSGTIGSAAFFAAHSIDAREPTDEKKPPKQPAEPLIHSLELLTSAPLDKMQEFYHKKLGFRIEEKRKEQNRLTILAGKSRITFVKAGKKGGDPFYHFAFNIPENKILKARNWQKERTELLPIPERLRDSKFPDDIVNYRHWNAHSVFFFDAAGNVVEYIARHDLDNGTKGEFSPDDILCVSEIGFIVDKVVEAADAIKKAVGLEQYRNGDDQFTALGDEQGLLLVMKRGRVISFDSKEKKAVDVFQTAATVRGSNAAKFKVDGFPYEIAMKD